MKNLLPLILFFAFALSSCEKEPAQDNPINDALDFSELLSLMGGELDQTRDKIPGQFHGENRDQEEILLHYHMIPANTNMNDTLHVLYMCNEDSMNEVWMTAQNEEAPLGLTNQMITSTPEKLVEGEYLFLWNAEANIDPKHFTTAKELLDYGEVNDTNTSDIRLVTGTWMVGKYQVFLAYVSLKTRMFHARIIGPRKYEGLDVLEEILVPDSCGLQLFE